MRKCLLLLAGWWQVVVALGQELPVAATAPTALAWRTRAQWATADLPLDNLLVTSSHTAPGGLTYVYVQQVYAGIPVYNRVATLVFVGGQLRHHAGTFVPTRQFAGLPTTPALPAATAVAQALGAGTTEVAARPATAAVRTGGTAGPTQRQTWAAPALARREVVTSLVWVVADRQRPRLAWNVNADLRQPAEWRNLRLDAATGQLLEQDTWTAHEAAPRATAPGLGESANSLGAAAPLATAATNASYYVVPFPRESPATASLQLEASPWLRAGAANAATTYGWQFDGASAYTDTRGNNTWAYDDALQQNAPGRFAPATSTSNGLVFQYQPDFSQEPGTDTNRNAATVNLFYWANLLHDVFYQYGFTEAAGNFQTSNMGRGGQGFDHVQAELQDGDPNNAANFTTGPDGIAGRMQLGLWAPPPTSSLQVTTPAAVAGSYVSTEGDLGPNNKLAALGPVSGPLALYPDGTTAEPLACAAAPANRLRGRVALVFRGDCSFATKVHNAQLAGALGVVVVNSGSGVLTMTDADNSLTIPAVMVAQDDGQKLAAALRTGQRVAVTLRAASAVQRDGAFDNTLISHEFGHGVSNRLTGGAANTSCLANAEQGGEGWSDYFALMLTTDWPTARLDDGPRARPMSAYVQNLNGNGLRRYAYSTDMATNPLTYADMASNVEVHAIGEIWCAALWDMTWNIIAQQAWIEPDIYKSSSAGGNTIALSLVMQGLQLQPCGPGFLDARDAILAADSLLYDGRYHCAIWQAFARRGMGQSARQGSPNSAADQVAAFDQPGMQLRKDPTPLIGTQFDVALEVDNDCGPPQQALTLSSQLPEGLGYVGSTGGTVAGQTVTFANVLAGPGQHRRMGLQLRAWPQHGCATSLLLNDNREDATTGGLHPVAVSPQSWAASWQPTTARAHSGSTSWYVADPETFTDAALVSATVRPGSAAVLSFYHYFQTEFGQDGGTVEISDDGGYTWQDAGPYFLQGGYNAAFASGAAAEQPCFTGRSSEQSGVAAFQLASLNLSSFAGRSIAIRFRFRADEMGGADGWYIDDIQLLSGCGGTQQVQLLGPNHTVLDAYSRPIFLLAQPLPVELVAFSATPLGASVRLNWTTASEQNSAYFELERSLDGLTFAAVGRVAAAGSSSSTRRYEWADAALPPGATQLYYRLHQVDTDGTAHYSEVRTVTLGGTTALHLAPNPTHTATTLSGAVPGAAVQVLDALGRPVYATTADASGTAQLALPAGLAAGIYVVRAGTQQTRLAVE